MSTANGLPWVQGQPTGHYYESMSKDYEVGVSMGAIWHRRRINSRMFCQLWWAPTLLGQTSFGWQHKLIRVYDAVDYWEAMADCYGRNMDARVPDDELYERYILIGPIAG